MKTITATPRTEKQAGLLTALLGEMGISYEVATVPEEDGFYPALEKQMEKDRKDLANGKGVRLSTKSFGDFYNGIGNHGG